MTNFLNYKSIDLFQNRITLYFFLVNKVEINKVSEKYIFSLIYKFSILFDFSLVKKKPLLQAFY